jgi:hypothetical protein
MEIENKKTITEGGRLLILKKLSKKIFNACYNDVDEVSAMNDIIRILHFILQSDSIEDYFQNVTDFEYYLNKFSKNVITNILRQISVF